MSPSKEKLHLRLGPSAVLVVLCSALLLFFTASLLAHSGGEVESNKTSAPITIDGNLDEWADAFNSNSPLNDIVVDPQDWYLVLPRNQMPGTGNTNNGGRRVSRGSFNGDADLSVRWATVWDDDYLYFAFDVTDDSVNNYPRSLNSLDGDIDGIWLLFDTKHDARIFNFPEGEFNTKEVADAENSEYQPDDEYWIFAPLTEGGEGIGWIQGDNDPVFSNAANGNVAGLVTDQGYTAEIRMPWSVFERPFGGPLVPEDGLVIGFDITMKDIDGNPPTYTEGEGGAMSWSSDFENDNTPGVLGDLIIKDAVDEDVPKILFMTTDPNNPQRADPDIAAHLEAMGHEVTFFTSADNVPRQDYVDAAMAHDAVIISETIGSSSIVKDGVFALRDVSVPVMSFEPFMYDDANWTGPTHHEDLGNTGRVESVGVGLGDPQDSIYIAEAAHPLAAGLADEVQVYKQPYSLNWARTLGDDATVVATVDEVEMFATIFVYEEGDKLVDGSDVPAARVGWFVGQGDTGGFNGPSWDNMTDDGLALFDAVVNFMVGRVITPSAPRFLRGDVDGNGDLQITDAIATLEYLFVGTFDPPCLDALDYDDDGGVVISDAVASLTHLFVGGPPPAEPGKETCGSDPDGDADELDCATPPEGCL